MTVHAPFIFENKNLVPSKAHKKIGQMNLENLDTLSLLFRTGEIYQLATEFKPVRNGEWITIAP